MRLEDFDYHLPEELIAQFPMADRTASRLLNVAVDRLEHLNFTDVTKLLKPGDLLVLNNTSVLPARLHGQKPTGGKAELLLERLLGDDDGLFQVRVSKPLKDEGELWFESKGNRVVATSVGRQGQFYHLKFSAPILPFLREHGEIPLPPYIERQVESEDLDRYQTVYHQIPGAVAAPTAGLHFSETLLQEVQGQGVEIAEVTLHVGAGTFQPVRGELQSHRMHEEIYQISDEATQQIERARRRGGRVVAVGTTVVRTLESAADQRGLVQPGHGETDLFIQPGFEFRVVDALITNFHLPKSTLMMLVSAFAGTDRIMQAYQEAVRARYRFFSYGDAMWLHRGSG